MIGSVMIDVVLTRRGRRVAHRHRGGLLLNCGPPLNVPLRRLGKRKAVAPIWCSRATWRAGYRNPACVCSSPRPTVAV